MEYGLQLYSLRDVGEKSFEETLKIASEQGYSFVETAGFGGMTAEQVKSLLHKYNLKLSSTHSSFDDLLNNYDETVKFHKEIGNKNYIIPYYSLKSQEEIDKFVELVNPMCEKLAADGITLGYHNHHYEFFQNEDGSVAYEQLVYRTDLKLEVDTYWAFIGMKHPINLLNRLKNRIFFLHVKDGVAAGDGKPLGLGEAPVSDVYKWAVENGVPMVVESETLTPNGPSETAICIEYLRSLENA